MAQNVTIAGRQYSAVPAINVPKTGGGTAIFTDVTDTTRIADDVRQGKYFFTASGVLTLGTATGGGGTGGVTQDQDGYLVLDDQGGTSITVEPITITQNGTTTAPAGTAYSPVTVNVSGGGGASNIIEGSFTAGSSEGAETINIPYTGNGYPVTISVWSPSIMANVQQAANYSFAWITVMKISAVAPTYDGNLYNNRYIAFCDYVENATYRSSTAPTGTWTAAGASATSSALLGLRTVSDTQLSIYVAGASYGFQPNTEYKYVVVYSS